MESTLETTKTPQWGTRKEAATRAKCSPRTIDRWIQAGILPAAKVGKVVRVNLHDVDRILRGNAA
ncbi:helix-turn-helix domain-containing protein [Zhihengliuella halotolerans]|uniref:helix-turn-helix domain-containing protein n=1 Tax=Zhihengliuella halotolerans TaxID=370736 RepID=UPI003570A482